MKLTWKAFFIFAAIFAAGMVAGGALGARWAHRPPFPRGQGQKIPSLEKFGENQMAMLSRQLSLTDEQRAKIAPIFAKTNEELRKLRTEGFKQTNAIFEEMDVELRNILTAEQAKKLEELRKHQRERIRGFIQPGPPPPPPEGMQDPDQRAPQNEQRPQPASEEQGPRPE